MRIGDDVVLAPRLVLSACPQHDDIALAAHILVAADKMILPDGKILEVLLVAVEPVR